MSTLSSSRGQETSDATTAMERGATTAPITLSERSITIFAIVRIFVGYLWFQQLFWKLPPDFKGLYPYIQREVHYAFIPGYGSLLQHTFLLGCTSTSSTAGCTLFVPLAAGVWIAELVVSISLMFGVFTRFGALLSTLLALQLYIGLSTSEWYWTYGTIVLLGLAITTIPAGRRLGIDQWLAPRLQAAASNARLARLLSWFV
jgi:thiosulfate dehydrogenase [quinone] large subunit